MRGLWTASVVVLLALFVIALAVGPVAIPMHDLWGSQIVRAVRLPRAVLALLVGAALGMSGGALQGVLRNGLAEPYLLGVSGGAAVGAVVAAMLGLAGPATTPLAALLGAVGAVVLVLIVARVGGGRGADPRVLIMAGVVVGAFANAAIMVALASAPADTVRGAVWWMMGSVADANWPGIAWLAAYITVGGGLLLLWAPEIDALALGDEAAAAIGVDVDRASRRIFLAAATVAAATVAAAGLVGFVGLVVPHIARSGGARASRPILGASALVGAALVLAADIAARTVRAPADLPLGAITALVGVPFFLSRLRRAGASP
jgi:iron complex transport system permease protein